MPRGLPAGDLENPVPLGLPPGGVENPVPLGLPGGGVENPVRLGLPAGGVENPGNGENPAEDIVVDSFTSLCDRGETGALREGCISTRNLAREYCLLFNG